jgi:sugar lactone lactonase YvrE
MATELRSFLSGGRYFEAPRWHDERLWVVDSLARTIVTARSAGEAEVVCRLDDIPAGLGFLPTGEFLVTGMFRRMLFTYAGGRVVPYADLTAIASGTIDDMIVDPHGRAYVGDLGFDLLRSPGDAAKGPSGQLILVAPDGSARVVAEGLRFPNGIAISNDARELVVAESTGDTLARYAIRADGGLDLLHRFGKLGEPDGICLDQDGAVWVGAYKEDAIVRVSPTGDELQRIPLPGRRGIACALGGPDRRTLFCVSAETTHEDLMRGASKAWVDVAEVAVPGVAWPGR